MKKALSEKMFVIGMDAMDPRLTKKYIEKGIMPNTKKIMEQGACRNDLVMLGGQPTVTPPMWTTLATGTYPNVHGITNFYRTSKQNIDMLEYNIDSRNCKAEQLWNVLAEAGKKTLVFHWPGSSWPPSSDSENLYVVDGTAPGSVNMGVAQVDGDMLINAAVDVREVKFIPKATTDSVAACYIDDVELEQEASAAVEDATKPRADAFQAPYIMDDTMGYSIGDEGVNLPLDVSLSPIKEASGWADLPEGAKEFVVLLSGGLVHRPALILKNEEGIYDKIAIYKNKNETTPIVELFEGKMVAGVVDTVYKKDEAILANRNMKVFDIAKDGSRVRMYASTALDISCDEAMSPKRIYKEITESAGFAPPTTMLYGQNPELYYAMRDCWEEVSRWYSEAIHHLIESEGIEVIFSHYHAIDIMMHTFVRNLKDRGQNKLSQEVYYEWTEVLYKLVDDYIGQYLDLLDQGWTLFIVSDHGQVCPEYKPPMLGDMNGVNVCLLEELGYTVMKRDENGNRLREIDWEQTRAIAPQGNNIYLNLKGRDSYGIVDPEDKYELEEKIISDLYSYRDPVSGNRVVSIALHNKDAVLLGYGGPECGDICYWIAEGYNYDHCDGLSTAFGAGETSLSPIFIAAGPGIKKGCVTDRVIRQVDLAPTMAVLAGVRMPAQCEGAPVYQIIDEQ